MTTLEDIIKNLPEDASDPEKLHPDLRPFYQASYPGLGMPMLHHPLIVDIAPVWPIANWRYEQVKPIFDEAVAAKDWDRALLFLTRPYRLDYLRTWFRNGQVSQAELRELLPHWWSDAEPDDTDRRWLAFWREAHGGKRIEDGEPLPKGDPLTIYRGVHSKNEKLGFAWTTDRTTAEFFARRFNRGQQGWIVTGTAHRRDVLAYTTGRGEFEVTIDPKKVSLGDYEPVAINAKDQT